MEHRFRLQAHEVWREGLVREGVYGQSADFADVLLQGVWNESRFVFGRYSPRKGEDTLTGNILFRPERGAEEENFLLATDAMGGMRGMGGPHFCKLGEFIFGSGRVDKKQIATALKKHQWGRVFYFNDDLRADGTMMPCDWGVFLAANGMGLWKWTTRDGVTWGKASNEGIFRWHHNPQSAARLLTKHSSFEIWRQFQIQLADFQSDAAFSRRWLQMEEEERFDEVTQWKNGSRGEYESVLRLLLLTEPTLQNARGIQLTTSVFEDEMKESHYLHELQADKYRAALSPRWQRAEETLRAYFEVELCERLPLCARNSYIGKWTYIHITEPTAHERLEAQLQLRAWAEERGLSFD